VPDAIIGCQNAIRNCPLPEELPLGFIIPEGWFRKGMDRRFRHRSVQSDVAQPANWRGPADDLRTAAGIPAEPTGLGTDPTIVISQRLRDQEPDIEWLGSGQV
jgi:hypothetical protein